MKKIIAYLMIISFCLAATGCRSDNNNKIRIAGMTGPTSIGLINLVENDDEYEFAVFGTSDEIVANLLSGGLDLAAIPANLAAVLYNKTGGEISVLAINTLGVLYIVQTGDSVSSISDLKGKTILATGKGSIPENTLRHILIKNGLDPDNDVQIEWKSEATEILSIMNAAECVAMLPQPYVTAAQMKNENIKIALDLNEEWEKIEEGSIVTGVLVATKTFLNNNEDAVSRVLWNYKESTETANSNVKDTAKLLEKHGIFKSEIAEKAIPKCNITFIEGNTMKDNLSKYLGVLNEENKNSIGGKLPDSDFYYGTK